MQKLEKKFTILTKNSKQFYYVVDLLSAKVKLKHFKDSRHLVSGEARQEVRLALYRIAESAGCNSKIVQKKI